MNAFKNDNDIYFSHPDISNLVKVEKNLVNEVIISVQSFSPS